MLGPHCLVLPHSGGEAGSGEGLTWEVGRQAVALLGALSPGRCFPCLQTSYLGISLESST